MKRLRTRFDTGTEITPNPRYLDYALDTLDLKNANTAPTPGVPSHKTLMCNTPELDYEGGRLFMSCLGALLYDGQDRKDAQ